MEFFKGNLRHEWVKGFIYVELSETEQNEIFILPRTYLSGWKIA